VYKVLFAGISSHVRSYTDVRQNHILCTVYVRNRLQGFHQMYGHTRIYGVYKALANPRNVCPRCISCSCALVCSCSAPWLLCAVQSCCVHCSCSVSCRAAVCTGLHVLCTVAALCRAELLCALKCTFCALWLLCAVRSCCVHWFARFVLCGFSVPCRAAVCTGLHVLCTVAALCRAELLWCRRSVCTLVVSNLAKGVVRVVGNVKRSKKC